MGRRGLLHERGSSARWQSLYYSWFTLARAELLLLCGHEWAGFDGLSSPHAETAPQPH